MKAEWKKHELVFKRPAGTSRGALHTKPSYFLRVQHSSGQVAYGECALLPGLSPDDLPHYEEVLTATCTWWEEGMEANAILGQLAHWPSIRFGWEMVLASFGLLDLGPWQHTAFEEGQAGLPINGLIWMGTFDFQQAQLHQLLEKGFDCVKFKIGRDYFSGGRALLEEARHLRPSLEIRVDANGAFSPEEARRVLQDLHQLQVHSIEQPLATGQWEQMADLIQWSPVPIALDEDLIFCPPHQQMAMLEITQPDYIILKPSLLGGWKASEEWIQLAQQLGVDYWTTSALESQLGLLWIARFAALHPVPRPQGLGTGSLYNNNLASDLSIKQQALWRSNVKDEQKVATDRLWP